MLDSFWLMLEYKFLYDGGFRVWFVRTFTDAARQGMARKRSSSPFIPSGISSSGVKVRRVDISERYQVAVQPILSLKRDSKCCVNNKYWVSIDQNSLFIN